MIDFPFTSFLSYEVPEVADLLLADPVNSPEALFKPVGVPWQIVIYHEIGILKVHAFASGVGGEQDADFGIIAEGFLALPAFVAMDAAMNGGDGFGIPDDSGNLSFQIV